MIGPRAAALLLLAFAMLDAKSAFAQAPPSPAPGAQPTVWYFYTVKWGFQDEFLNLFQKNHYPVLKEQMKRGRIVEIRTYAPTYHGDGRADWTFAVALTYPDAATLAAPSGDEAIARKLYPDWTTFQKEEARRFELLVAHWDVPLSAIDFETRKPALK